MTTQARPRARSVGPLLGLALAAVSAAAVPAAAQTRLGLELPVTARTIHAPGEASFPRLFLHQVTVHTPNPRGVAVYAGELAPGGEALDPTRSVLVARGRSAANESTPEPAYRTELRSPHGLPETVQVALQAVSVVNRPDGSVALEWSPPLSLALCEAVLIEPGHAPSSWTIRELGSDRLWTGPVGGLGAGVDAELFVRVRFVEPGSRSPLLAHSAPGAFGPWTSPERFLHVVRDHVALEWLDALTREGRLRTRTDPAGRAHLVLWAPGLRDPGSLEIESIYVESSR